LQAAKVSAAVKAVMKARATGDYGQGVMLGTQAVLAVFPDMFSLWNVRREALKLQLDESDGNGSEICSKELVLVKACLTENPKSYSAWHHRRWVMELGCVSLDKELSFVEECVPRGMTAVARHGP
jgi:geranylgeranyl transferase type-2 subunit alpha